MAQFLFPIPSNPRPNIMPIISVPIIVISLGVALHAKTHSVRLLAFEEVRAQYIIILCLVLEF